MLARASLIVLALASPAWADPDGYPAGLFERSPLSDTPAAVSPRSRNPAPRKANGTSFTPSERADGACHHYRVWSAIRGRNHCARRTSAPSPPEQAWGKPARRQ